MELFNALRGKKPSFPFSDADLGISVWQGMQHLIQLAACFEIVQSPHEQQTPLLLLLLLLLLTLMYPLMMKGDSIDKVRIEAKTKDIIPMYMHRWNTYNWACMGSIQ